MDSYEVFSHKGRKFRRSSQPLIGTHNYPSLHVPHHSPPPPPPQPIPSRIMLPPPQPLSISKSRPMSAKIRLQPTKLDPSNEYRIQFALQHSQPLPPIADTSGGGIYEADSAVDLDYISQCGTPLTPHNYYTHCDSVIDHSPHDSPKLPLPGHNKRVQLGLKLPNSDRIENDFLLTSTIQDIIDYAERYSGVDLQDCTVSTNGLTRTVLDDKTMTLQESGIDVRTVLYFS